MAKKPSEKLYRLIQSLSSTERRYFSIYIKSKTGRDSKYARLFEAICQMDTPDDGPLKKIIYKSQELETKKFSELKAYLYEQVLKALQQYDENLSVELRLNHQLQSIGILFKRGHYEDCQEILQKVYRLAQQYEAFTQQLEVLRWEKKIAYTRMDADFFHTELDRIQYEESRIMELLDNAAAYRQAFFRIYSLVKKEANLRDPNRIKPLRKIIEGPMFNDPDKALSHKARITYYRTLNLYHYAVSEFGQFYDSGNRLIGLLESQPHFLKEDLSDYIAALSNYILACGLLHKYEKVDQALNKLRKIKPITADDRRKLHRQYYTARFVLCIFTGEFEKGKSEMKRCQEEALRLQSVDYETASFYFQYCCISLGCGDFREALDHLNYWMNQPKTVEREDLQSLARILNMVLHYELGNQLLLESLIRSTTRFLVRKNRYSEVERKFIQLFTELMKAPSKEKEKEIFGRIRAEIRHGDQDPAMRSLMQTFDLEAWIDSKFSGTQLALLVQQKWKSR